MWTTEPNPALSTWEIQFAEALAIDLPRNPVYVSGVLSLTEDLVLLALDDHSGRILPVDDIGYRHALAGAVLLDLALLGRLENHQGKLRVTDHRDTGESLLDGWRRTIESEEDPLEIRVWIARLALAADQIETAALTRLVDRGILEKQETNFLWVFETRRYPMLDGTEEEVKRRICDVLLSDEEPSQADAILVGLVDDARLLPHILSDAETRESARRVAQVRDMDVIGKEVATVIEHLRLEMLQVLTQTHQ
jgi:Golgi phosphoprotein 3